MRNIVLVVVGILLGILPTPALSMTDQDAQKLIEEVRSLRTTVEDQNRRIQDLESKINGGRADAPVAAHPGEAAPSPDDLGSQAPMPDRPSLPRSTGPVIGARQGEQPKIGVIFDAAYTGGKNVADNAEVREVELNMGAAVDPYADLYAQVAFTPDEVELEQAYVTLKLPWYLQARIGKERMPFGDLNSLDQDGFPQVDRPHALNQFFGPEGLNPIGGHIEWLAPFAVNPTLSLTFGAYNRAVGEANTAATDKDGDGNPDVTDIFLDAGAFNVRDRERGPLLLGRISSFIGWGDERHALRVGGSWARDENDATGATHTTITGIDAKYRWRPDASGRGITIAGEYLHHRREELPTTLFLANSGSALSNNGGYIYGQYDFNRRWGLGYRYDNSNTVFSSTNEITSHSAYGEFRPSEFSRLRAQYRRDDRNFDATANGNRTDDDADVFLLQFTHLIGWHPSHKF